MITIYGIANCDKCRSAIKWFDSHNCEYRFHDLRADGLDKPLLKRLTAETGAAELINKRSTTWRNIPDGAKTATSETALQTLILDHPTLIKRPVVDTGKQIHVGHDEAAWQRLLP